MDTGLPPGELVLEVRVGGKPEPQGSTQAFVPTHPKTKQPYRRAGGGIVVNVTSDNPALKGWRERVEDAARAALGPFERDDELGYSVEVVSFVKRREADWGTGRNAHLLKDHAPAYPVVLPDVDKLLRAILDAITGVIYASDGQVTDALTRKRGAVPGEDDDGRGALIRVWRNDIQRAGDLPLAERVRTVAPRDDESAPSAGADDAPQMALA